MSDDLLTTTEAAARLGCTRDQVRAMCKEGSILARKFGRDWQIASSALEGVAIDKRRGWPKDKKRGPKQPPEESTDDTI